MNDLTYIPEELKKTKQWVCFTLPDKLPKNPHTGGNAQSNNRATWGDYKTAVKAVQKFGFDGVGFMFAPPYFGVDLDDCTDEIKDEFIDTLHSYAEISTSGRGIHIICRGELPEGGRRRGKVEMYSAGRYFIMTGNSATEEPLPIKDCTESIKLLHAKYLAPLPLLMQSKEFTRITMDDQEVIDKARSCKSGMAFQALYSGQWHGSYSSQSEADIALCGILAFWCQRDESQIDRIFRSSGLMRPKWDRRQGGSTYGQLTVSKAAATCAKVYEPTKNDTAIVVNPTATKQYIPAKSYEFSDSGNAARFADEHRGFIKYSHVHKRWFYWDGKRWEEDLIGNIKSLADITISHMKEQAFATEDDDDRDALLKWSIRTASAKGKKAMIEESTHLSGIPVLPEEFDAEPEYLNCQNGIINLKNGELIEHSPNFMISKISHAEFKPGRDCLEWERFLYVSMNGDEELIHYLQKAVGYSLSGETKEQCAFFLYGTGSNGKSTFLNAIREVAGSYAMNAQPETVMMRQNNNGATSDLARLQSARFVTTVEPAEGMRLNEGLIKQLTGEDPITARFLYGQDFQFIPKFKIWMATNHKPIIRGTDNGIWRRIHLIPFTVSIPPEMVDKDLPRKLRAELPGILEWAVKGYILWRKEGLEPPASVVEATKEYRQEMDIMNSFIECCLDEVPKTKERAAVVFQAYQRWARDNNEWAMSGTRFGKELSKRYEKIKDRTGTFYYGIKVKKDCVLESWYA